MSNNAEFDALAQELRALREESCGNADARARESMLVIRLVHGLSQQRWQEFRQAFPLSQWCALPVTNHPPAQVADLRPDMQAPLPSDMSAEALAGAVNAEVFTAQLNRDLLRLARNGGNLSLIYAALVQRRTLCVALGEGTVKRLEALLAETLCAQMDACDSLGRMPAERYALLLPGMGRLAARHLAERLQNTFAEQARPLFPTGGISAGAGAHCALGIVCVVQGGENNAAKLLTRADTALNMALEQERGYIHQESPDPQNEQTTLVLSSEKRFLFFGGEYL